jgi:hypothetical protein
MAAQVLLLASILYTARRLDPNKTPSTEKANISTTKDKRKQQPQDLAGRAFPGLVFLDVRSGVQHHHHSVNKQR